jgi:hypothetical protein
VKALIGHATTNEICRGLLRKSITTKDKESLLKALAMKLKQSEEAENAQRYSNVLSYREKRRISRTIEKQMTLAGWSSELMEEILVTPNLSDEIFLSPSITEPTIRTILLPADRHFRKGQERYDEPIDRLRRLLENPNCPVDILHEMAITIGNFSHGVTYDHYRDVKASVVKNPNCPIPLLEKYMKSCPNDILERPELPVKTAIKMLHHDGVSEETKGNILYSMWIAKNLHVIDQNCSLDFTEKKREGDNND